MHWRAHQPLSLRRSPRDPRRWRTLRLPAHSGLAKGGTGGRSGTAAGTKRKPEVGPTPPRSKTKKKRTFTPAGQTFRQAEADNLLGVVLVQDHPYTVLSRVQLDRVCERLLQSIEAAIDFGN